MACFNHDSIMPCIRGPLFKSPSFLARGKKDNEGHHSRISVNAGNRITGTIEWYRLSNSADHKLPRIYGSASGGSLLSKDSPDTNWDAHEARANTWRWKNRRVY